MIEIRKQTTNTAMTLFQMTKSNIATVAEDTPNRSGLVIVVNMESPLSILRWNVTARCTLAALGFKESVPLLRCHPIVCLQSTLAAIPANPLMV